MPPENQYVNTTPQVSGAQPHQTGAAPEPDYSFLDEQPKKSVKLPFNLNLGSFTGRLIAIVVIGLLLVILIVIIRGIISPAPFNKADYLLVAERQNEMLHILTSDINSSNFSQLSSSDQNFVSTASATLNTAASKTLGFMSDNKDKVNTKTIDKVIDSTIDNDLASAQSANNLDSAFRTEMQIQLSDYEQNLKSAFNSTRSINGRELLQNEYSEARLLLKAIPSSS